MYSAAFARIISLDFAFFSPVLGQWHAATKVADKAYISGRA